MGGHGRKQPEVESPLPKFRCFPGVWNKFHGRKSQVPTYLRAGQSEKAMFPTAGTRFVFPLALLNERILSLRVPDLNYVPLKGTFFW